MNKRLFGLLFSICALALFVACVSDDDNTGIDEEWKAYSEQQIRDVENGSEYSPLSSQSQNGKVYWKNISFIAETAPKTKITEDKTPYYTDSIAVRYEGYFLDEDGTKYTFDTTEGETNGVIYRGRVSGFIDGFSTMLQNMTKGQQVEVVIPYQLGYGTSPQYDGSNVLKIPAYTTLRFKIYLVDIIPDNPGEFD